MKCNTCLYSHEVNGEENSKRYCEFECFLGKDRVEIDWDKSSCSHYINAEDAMNEYLKQER